MAKWPATTSTTSRSPARSARSRAAASGPCSPLNLVGDYGGGGMFMAFGVVCGAARGARLRPRPGGRRRDGRRVGAARRCCPRASRRRGMERGARAPTCSTPARTSTRSTRPRDGGYVAVGAIEPQFYAELLGCSRSIRPSCPSGSRERWPEFKERFAAAFRCRSREEWAAMLEPAEACATAVYTLGEAHRHPHMAARGTFIEVAGVLQPGPAPRFSRTPGAVTRPPSPSGADTDSALAAWGVEDQERAALRSADAIH